MYFAAPIRFIKGRRLNLEGEELRLELDVSSFDIEVCRNGSLEAHKWEMHLFSSSEFPEGPEWNRVLNSARQRKTLKTVCTRKERLKQKKNQVA
ncbi:uncharacterized protein LOC132615589 isoform X3 [Lycium barbarum]|uniref:uncharacterized protein LOC132615589 isoform X3 n=1 Tax=Lycium barbarum TaxID=112863 RepID=UPI00293EE2C4|nr:uncharacterized protein LOC132615589 isoform X3 [Lycium barbarum]